MTRTNDIGQERQPVTAVAVAQLPKLFIPLCIQHPLTIILF